MRKYAQASRRQMTLLFRSIVSTRRRYGSSKWPASSSTHGTPTDIIRPCLAPRMWILSLLFSLTGSAANLFFSLRYPSVAITPIIALVLVHPLGKFWDVLLKRSDDPIEVFENGTLSRRDFLLNDTNIAHLSWPVRLRLWLGQGRWNEKEHACVYISSNVSFGFAFATDVSHICLSTTPIFRRSGLTAVFHR